MSIYSLKLFFNFLSVIELYPVNGNLEYTTVKNYIYIGFSFFSVLFSISLHCLNSYFNLLTYWSSKLNNLYDSLLLNIETCIFYSFVILVTLTNCYSVKSVFNILKRIHLINSNLRLINEEVLSCNQRTRLLSVLLLFCLMNIYHFQVLLPDHPSDLIDQVVKNWLAIWLQLSTELIVLINENLLVFLDSVKFDYYFLNFSDMASLNGQIRDSLGPSCLLIILAYYHFFLVNSYEMLLSLSDGVDTDPLFLVVASLLSLTMTLLIMTNLSSKLKSKVRNKRICL